jgi:hypothetical protein
MELVNIKLVHIENMLFNILENENENGINIDAIINITNKLSSMKNLNCEPIKKIYKHPYTKFFCICMKIVPIDTTHINIV